MIDIDREKLAWAGGFFEGEGTISIHTTRRESGYVYRQPQLSIGSTDLDALQRFRVSVGYMGKIHGPYDRGGKPIYSYNLAGLEKVQAVAAMLFDFLCERRQTKTIEVLRTSSLDHQERLLRKKGCIS